MSGKKTARQRVLEVYPNAFGARGYGIWSGETVQILANGVVLGEAHTPAAAWEDAARLVDALKALEHTT